MKKAPLLIVAATVVAAAAVTLPMWRSHVVSQQRARHITAAERLVQERRPQDALAVIRLVRQESGSAVTEAERTRLEKAEVQATVDLHDVFRLLALYQQEPETTVENEDAALLVSRSLGAMGRTEEAGKVREQWRGHERQEESWLLLEADQAMRRDPEAARALLTSRKFPGKADCERLMRLALLSVKNPPEAIQYLDAAYAADPHNADLRSFRGQILESAGERGLARVEYTAALVATPGNPLLRDQLADFYLRQRDYAQAVQTYGDAIQCGAPDFIQVKARFWGAVTSPLPPGKGAPESPAGNLKPLADFLAAIPSGEFWDEAGFQKLRMASQYTAQRREVFWLRLLDHLRHGRESEAAEMLATNPFRSRSADPGLESALRVMLKYRLTGVAPVLGDIERGSETRHQFFQQLAAWSKGDAASSIEAFAAGKNAFAGAFLAAGWSEAALHLISEPTPADAAPEWFAYGITQALRLNRGDSAALAFAEKQAASPVMRLVRGEILFATGEPEKATAILRPLASEDSDAGLRAAWLLGVAAIEKRDAAGAAALIQAQPRLAASTQGRELTARIALVERRDTEAREIYASIEKESTEAKLYLAQQAGAEKHWDEARRLTQSLVAQFPDEPTLRQRLVDIDREAAAK